MSCYNNEIWGEEDIKGSDTNVHIRKSCYKISVLWLYIGSLDWLPSAED